MGDGTEFLRTEEEHEEDQQLKDAVDQGAHFHAERGAFLT